MRPLRSLLLLLCCGSAMAIQRARAGLDELLVAKRALPFQVLTGGDAAFLERHDAFVFDCDGVLYSGSELLDGAAAAVAALRSAGKRCLFVTNNSGQSRRTTAAKLGALGLAATPEECVPASFATAAALAARGVTRAFVVGADGLSEELELAGVEVLKAGATTEPFSEAAFERVVLEGEAVGAVVVGMDATCDLRTLALASLHLQRDESCLFASTNPDAFDVVGGRRMPGNGALVAALATASGRGAPDLTCGKPAPALAESLVSTFGLDPARTVVVGDRVDTDMALAGRMGCAGLLVLTGCATAADAAALAPGCATTFVTSHLGALAGPGALVGEPWTAAPDTVDGVLDALHAAAARADADSYLDLVSSDFVFLGTDATERWDRAAFEAYARGRFDAGNGWAYEVVSRRATARGDVVFFDEDLANANLGACRSTGVLVRDGGRLKVAQYSLSVPIPNDLCLDVVRQIRARD